MKSLLGLVLVAALLALGWFAYNAEGDFLGRDGRDMTQLVYLVMWLLLATGAGYGFSRFRLDGGRALAGLAFWAVLIVALVFGYQMLN